MSHGGRYNLRDRGTMEGVTWGERGRYMSWGWGVTCHGGGATACGLKDRRECGSSTIKPLPITTVMVFPQQMERVALYSSDSGYETVGEGFPVEQSSTPTAPKNKPKARTRQTARIQCGTAGRFKTSSRLTNKGRVVKVARADVGARKVKVNDNMDGRVVKSLALKEDWEHTAVGGLKGQVLVTWSPTWCKMSDENIDWIEANSDIEYAQFDDGLIFIVWNQQLVSNADYEAMCGLA